MKEQTDILQLISAGENVELECKEAGQGLSKDLWETYSSFANSNGGIILLGVKQKGNLFQVSGVDATKRLKEFWDLINNSQKVSYNILNDNNVENLTIDGMQVIKICVPRAERKQKPIYIGQNPITGTYRRNYEGDYRCSLEEIKSMLADQCDQSDSRVLEYFDLSDINMDSFRSFRERFASIRPVHPWVGLSDKQFLYKIEAWGKIRETGKEGLTVAGLLMFGDERVIKDEYPNYFLEFRQKNTKELTLRWDYRTTSSDGTWSGNLYDFYFKIINRLTDNINIPFKLDGHIRKDDTRVHEAIREALANALIHSDYSGSQGIVIEKETMAFKFSNPGTLRISMEQAFIGGISDPRNPSIFKMFYLIGVGERAGSGLGNIQLAWKEQNWRNPLLLEKFQPDRVELTLRTTSLLPQESIDMLVEVLKESCASLSKDEVIALVTAHQEGQVTNSRLQVLSEKPSGEVGKIISSLVEKGLLVSDGQKRGMKYYLSDVFKCSTEINEGDSINMAPNSVNIEPNSVSNEDETMKRVHDISKVARQRRRIDINEMKEIILKLCEVRPLMLKELADLLDRSQDGIRNNYLSQLKADGKIKLRYPGQINHPQQAYITNKQND